ncbi:MAG TPA: hypothetical protein VHQ46_01105 [Desulfobacteria bacterium]|nr:hypothetical protein [Desulfobacteria bacterium]
MRAVFSLTTAESKRLIAKGVVNTPVIQHALHNGKIIIAGGITNAYVVEELLGIKIEEKYRYTAGIVTQGGFQCVTPAEDRIQPYVVEQGKVSDKLWVEALEEFTADDVMVKGANALDAEGIAGVIVSNPAGGTIGRALGIVSARGSNLLVPVGLEKMVPSVSAAARAAGIGRMDYSLGQPVGLIPIINGTVITEIIALEQMFDVKATCIGCGGVGGSEGAVTLVIEGSRVPEALKLIKSIKGEPAVIGKKQRCRCQNPCNR